MQKSDTEFVNLLLRNQAVLHKICRAYCPMPEDRRDLFQEIALQLWRAHPQFRGEAKESTWIYRVALNVAISSRRKSKPTTAELKETQFQIPEIPDDQAAQTEMLYEAMHALTDLEKALLLLHFEEKTGEEIAALTGLTANNVRVKMHRIKEKLRAKIQTISST